MEPDINRPGESLEGGGTIRNRGRSRTMHRHRAVRRPRHQRTGKL